MPQKLSICVATILLYVVRFVASLGDVIQSSVLVDPQFADDDDSALLIPIQATPVPSLRAAPKSRTAVPSISLHAATNAKQEPEDKAKESPSDASVAAAEKQTEGKAQEPASDAKPQPEGKAEQPTSDASAAAVTKDEPESRAASNQEVMNKLIDSLIGPGSGYHKTLRPLPDCSAYDCSHRIGVTMTLDFEKLLGVDEIHNQLEMLAIFSLNWPDHRLAYNASDWFPHLFDWRSDSDFVAIDPNLLWRPDIQLVNAAEPMEEVFKPRAFLYDDVNRLKNGYNVRLKVPCNIKVKCDLVMDEFPFDNQTCKFFYQAWSASKDWISFKAHKIMHANETMSQLTSVNEEFQVTSVAMKDDMIEVNHNVFPQIIYTLTLQRYSHYYVSSIILPMLMMVLLSVGVFYIDPPGGERLGYNITLILTVMATSFFAADRLPKSGGGDTWLERFQAICYIITISPLIVSLFCELFRRCAIRHGHAGDDDGGWIAYVIDHIFRVPYAIATAVFIYMVWDKFHSKSGSREESVLAIVIFLYATVIVMCVVGVADLILEGWRLYNKK